MFPTQSAKDYTRNYLQASDMLQSMYELFEAGGNGDDITLSSSAMLGVSLILQTIGEKFAQAYDANEEAQAARQAFNVPAMFNANDDMEDHDEN